MKLVNYFKRLKDLLNKRDRFLVVEISKHCIRVSSLQADFNQRKIHLIKIKTSNIDADDDIGKIHGKIKKLVASFGRSNKYNIILNIDSRFATTIHTSLSMVREKSKIPVDEADLDNLISQAVWKFYDRQRSRVAAKMGINDLDVLLSDIHIKGIKLDGHKVVNPIGFSAKSVEIQLSATFTARDFINGLKALIPKENIVFIGESGATYAYVFSHIHGTPEILAAHVFPRETALFSSTENSLMYVDSFPWGEADLQNSVAKFLNVSPKLASGILKMYAKEKTSVNFAKKFERFLIEELQTFAKGIESFVRHTEIRDVYVHPFFPMPPVVFSNTFKNKFGTSVRLIHAHDDLVSEKLNLELKLNRKNGHSNLLALISGIVASSFYPQSEKISKIAKRRIRWLI